MSTGSEIDAAKQALRARLIEARRALTPDQLAAARAAVREHVLARFEPAWTDVFAYQPWRSEPGSPELLAGLADRGARVHVPIRRADNDLDWTRWPAGDEAAAHPTAETIGEASVVFVPALAVDPHGRRIGRGGGSYDRALVRVRPGVAVVALLHGGEIVDRVPTDQWDRSVTAAVTPAGWVELG